MTETKFVLAITGLKVTLAEPNFPIKFCIEAEAKVPDGSWTNGQLIELPYPGPPEDGMYDFDFKADVPIGSPIEAMPADPGVQPMTTITASITSWERPEGFKGLRVFAELNHFDYRP